MKVYTVEQLQTLIDGMEVMTPVVLKEIVVCFPYEDMVNIKSYDDQLMRKYAEFLTKLANTPYFNEKFSNVRNTLHFLWNKLCDVNDIDAAEVVTDLLLLYYNILYRVSGDIRILEFIVGSERTLRSVFCVLQSRLLNMDHCTILTNILYLLISTDRKFMEDSVPILKIMFHQLRATSNTKELAVICTLVVREYYTIDTLFDVCGNWLLSMGPELLRDHISEETAKNLLEGIAIIIVSTNLPYPVDFWKKMQRILSRLLHFLDNANLNENSMLLILSIVSNYVGTKQSVMLELLKRLPKNVRQWPDEPNCVFFIICELIYQNDDHFWSPRSILKAIPLFVHSVYRFSPENVVLKSMCYLYPLLQPPIPSPNYTVIGDSLLILVTKKAPQCIESICSLHKNQLSWMLSRGDFLLKKNVICYWLKCGHVDEVAQVLRNTPSVKLLRALVLDPYLDQEVSERLEELICKSLNTEFLQNLILYIPVEYKNGVILSRLLRIGCKVPDDPELMFKLCHFLLRMLLFVEEANMKPLFTYITEMLVRLRTHENFNEFYKLTKIWKFLVYLNIKDGGVSTEIIRLFKIMTMIQKSKKLSIDQSIEINLVNSLRGNDDETAEKALQLLHYILSSDDSFVKLHEGTVSSVFIALFDLCAKPRWMAKSLNCLVMIMRRKPLLSVRKATVFFVEYHTWQIVDEELCPNMVLFLKCWLKSIKHVQKCVLKQQVNFSVLKNFLERISCMPCIKRHDIKLHVDLLVSLLQGIEYSN